MTSVHRVIYNSVHLCNIYTVMRIYTDLRDDYDC